jgi:hypothetical protein
MSSPFLFFLLLSKRMLIHWYVHDDEPDTDTEIWAVQLECDWRGIPTVQVIEVETIACAAHLLPVYGSLRVPDDFSHHDAFIPSL